MQDEQVAVSEWEDEQEGMAQSAKYTRRDEEKDDLGWVKLSTRLMIPSCSRGRRIYIVFTYVVYVYFHVFMYIYIYIYIYHMYRPHMNVIYIYIYIYIAQINHMWKSTCKSLWATPRRREEVALVSKMSMLRWINKIMAQMGCFGVEDVNFALD